MAGKKGKKTAKKLNYSNLEPSDVSCPLCNTLLHVPVTLPCNHVFCLRCLKGATEKANLVCPLCRLRLGAWYRNAEKDGKVVDEELQKAIQAQYPVEVKNKHRGIYNKLEKVKPTVNIPKLTLPVPPRKSYTSSPAECINKKYTCHVLPSERNRVKVNPTSNLFISTEFKNVFSNMEMKPTQASEQYRRRSGGISGYKSSCSNSDIIDREYSQYFRPIEPMRRFHQPGKVPFKVLPLLGINDGTVPIEPPSGKCVNIGSRISAFVKYIPNDQPDQRPPSCLTVESESKSCTPSCSINNLKRKLTLDPEPLSRKKVRRRTFGAKKNLLTTFSSHFNLSPVDNSLFYGFNDSDIQHSERVKSTLDRQLIKHRHLLGEKTVTIKVVSNKKYPIYGKFLQQLNIAKAPVTRNKRTLVVPRLQPNKPVEPGKQTDINRNVPNSFNSSMKTNSRSARILNRALKVPKDPPISTNKVQYNIMKAASPALATKVEDIKALVQTRTEVSAKSKSGASPELDALCKPLETGTTNKKVDTGYSTLVGDGSPASVSKKVIVEAKAKPWISLGMSDSEPENEAISKLIDDFCNATESENTLQQTSIEVQKLIGLGADEEATKRVTRNSLKQSPKIEKNMIKLSPKASRKQKMPSKRVSHTKKLVYRLPKKNDTPRSQSIINKLKAAKKRSRKTNDEEEQRRKREEADFELAKKLQAQFDLIHVTSTTRRGTKRQINLNETLA